MYLDNKFMSTCGLIIPAEILYNVEVKQLLPVYITLCVACDMSYDDVAEREVTLRQLCKSTCTMNTKNMRRGQYRTLQTALLWLQENDYATYEGVDWNDTGHGFKIRMNDDIYKLISSREDKRNRGYTRIPYSEIFMVRTALFYLDKTENSASKIMTTYFYMRSRCLLWQKELGTKFPAWCGNFSQICATFNFPVRTFTRIIDTMAKIELVSVTRLNYNYGKTSKMPTEIVAFNFLCDGEDVYTTTKHVQENLCRLYGKKAQWYLTGVTSAKLPDNSNSTGYIDIDVYGLPECKEESTDGNREPVEMTVVDLDGIIPEEAMKNDDDDAQDDDELYEKYMDALDSY